MNQISTVHCCIQYPFIRLGWYDSVFFYISVNRAQIKLRDDIIIFFTRAECIRADYTDMVAFLTQCPDEMHSGNRCSIVFLTQHIAYNNNRQSLFYSRNNRF